MVACINVETVNMESFLLNVTQVLLVRGSSVEFPYCNYAFRNLYVHAVNDWVCSEPVYEAVFRFKTRQWFARGIDPCEGYRLRLAAKG